MPLADPTSRSFLVKIPLQNPGNLISGMFVRIELPRNTSQQIITVPATDLIKGGQLEGVYVVEIQQSGSQSSTILRRIKTGKIQSGQVEVVSGLSPGDQIITSHIQQLNDGQRVIFRN